MKRFISIILTVIILLSSIPISITALVTENANNTLVEIWGGHHATSNSAYFNGGDGSENNPYIIANGTQLYNMIYDSGKVNGNPAYYKLACDIYLNDISNYDKWGSAEFDMSSLNNWVEYEDKIVYRKFAGNFNGDGHCIYGLYACGYRIASFLPAVDHGAVVRNVNFSNSYVINTSNLNSADLEDSGETTGQKVWYAGAFGAAGVVSGCCHAGDSDYSTIDFTIKNCSVRYAYVEAAYFTSAFVASANSCQPYVKDCLVVDVELNATNTTKGVEGAVFNMPYGSVDETATIENVISIGNQIYGAGREEMWSGKKIPSVSHTYDFKNVYSDVSHYYEIQHSSYGKLTHTDSEVTIITASELCGLQVEESIKNFDWVYTWRAVEGDYPVVLREYVVPSGKEYYESGGPKYATDIWDGSIASHFAAGDGSIEDPYLISSCEEFCLMMISDNTDRFYKIADGVTDLYFNDIEGKSYSQIMTYFSFGIGTNYNLGEDLSFGGSFDGNGVNIQGVYCSGKDYAGLFPQAASCTLKNFSVKNSYIKTTNTNAAGAAVIVGQFTQNAKAYLRNIAVIDCNVQGNINAAGLVGCVNEDSLLYIENSIVSGGKIQTKASVAYKSAFVANGDSDSLIAVKNSISLGIHPSSIAEASYSAGYSGVYTDTSAPSDESQNINGINIVEASALKGEQAVVTCIEFDWQNSWSATNDIPMPKNQSFYTGEIGKSWSGEVASTYAGGDGSESNPYKINTAEMLAKMLRFGEESAYYELSADIYINDINDPNWHNVALQWYTSKDVVEFTGSFNGAGFTIYGLFNSKVEENEYAALIPVLGSGAKLNKVKIDNAYLEGKAGAYLGGVVGVVKDNAAVAPVISFCEIGANVLFEGEANAGGIVSCVGFTRIKIRNSVFKGNIKSTGGIAGIVTEVLGKVQVKECISKNIYPFVLTENITAENVYTSEQETDIQGVLTLDIDNMTGDNAKTYMTGLDFSVAWRTVSNDLPIPTGNVKASNGTAGVVWSGDTATGFAGGKGTQAEPYLIETGEQLALAISTRYNFSTAYFKLTCDIYLNDINDELWTVKAGATQWIHSNNAGTFAGNFDGDGYVVYGMYYYYNVAPKNSYLGLFPRVGGSAVIKNIGVSQAYIKTPVNETNVYAGGLLGMGNAFYDFYGNKIGPSDTVNDEFLVPGESSPRKLPSFTNCFIDHTCYIEAYAVGGIGCPGGMPIVIRDCYVTATLVGFSDTSVGALIGSQWSMGSRIYNSVAFPQNDIKSSVGSHQWVENEASICYYHENVYYYGSKKIWGTTRVVRPQWRVGDAAQEHLPDLDWQNTWRVEQDGTPVLRIFDKDNRSAAEFSDKSFVVPDVSISFETGVDNIYVESITGQPYDEVSLPIPEREGYKFVCWHAYEDLSLEYPYDYFLPRDLTLYAEWKSISVTQDFEDYPFTLWDCDTTIWNYNIAQSTINYNEDFVLSGKGSMQLMSGSTDVAALLMNYEKTLTAGQTYTISLWVANEEDTQPQLALAHKMYPDYMAADKLIEPLTSQGNSVNGWTQYTHTFVAQTPWVALKVLYSGSLYVDDIVITSNGDLLTDAVITSNIDEGEFYANILENITLSSGVTTVGDFAFAYSDFITDVIISDSVKQIGEYAFYDCDRITDVWYAGSQEDFENITISANNESLKNAVWHFDSCAMGIEHSYDNNCDSICNNCKYVRAVSEHIYDGAIDTDCNVCGYVRDAALIGDVNGDNTINNKDLGLLMQYLNDWDVEIVAENSDVNVDSSINNKDYGILMQYLNGWDVNLGYPN